MIFFGRGKTRNDAENRMGMGVFSVQSSQSPPVGTDGPAEPRESVACRGVRLSGSFALGVSQSTPRAMQSAVAHRISR